MGNLSIYSILINFDYSYAMQSFLLQLKKNSPCGSVLYSQRLIN